MNTFRIETTLGSHNAPQTPTRVLEVDPEGGEAVNTGEADPGKLAGQPRPLRPPNTLTVQKLVEAATRAAQCQHVQRLELSQDLHPDLVRDSEDPLLGGRGGHVQLHEDSPRMLPNVTEYVP